LFRGESEKRKIGKRIEDRPEGVKKTKNLPRNMVLSLEKNKQAEVWKSKNSRKPNEEKRGIENGRVLNFKTCSGR